MAKDEKKTVDQQPEEPSKALPEFPQELEFICRICSALQNRKERTCPHLKIQGQYCQNLERLRVKLVTLEHECENHRKYINAFRKRPYYTEDEIKKIYSETIATETPVSESEFLDYCRAFGFEIV